MNNISRDLELKRYQGYNNAILLSTKSLKTLPLIMTVLKNEFLLDQLTFEISTTSQFLLDF